MAAGSHPPSPSNSGRLASRFWRCGFTACWPSPHDAGAGAALRPRTSSLRQHILAKTSAFRKRHFVPSRREHFFALEPGRRAEQEKGPALRSRPLFPLSTNLSNLRQRRRSEGHLRRSESLSAMDRRWTSDGAVSGLRPLLQGHCFSPQASGRTAKPTSSSSPRPPTPADPCPAAAARPAREPSPAASCRRLRCRWR